MTDYIEASACGKLILCGEHAVVYGYPSLAIPLPQMRATAQIHESSGGCVLNAPDLGMSWRIDPNKADDVHPLVTTVLSACGHFDEPLPSIQIELQSQIPIGKGLGSGAAMTAAIFRALAAYFGKSLIKSEELHFIHQIETLYHATPSGIDGAVIAHEQALCFEKGQPLRFIDLPTGWTLLLADTGPAPPTREMVLALRERYEELPHRYELLFTAIGAISRQVEVTLQTSAFRSLGRLLNRNQILLHEIGVSSPGLEALAQTARQAGALGAKLSGGGGGGILMAICFDQPERILSAWQQAGVQKTWQLHFELLASFSGR